jgi:large subunit ribosomal protein L29
VTRVGELRDQGDDELIERLESFKEELFNLRFQLATGQLDNPMRIKQVRHDVARILTVLRERHVEREIEEEIVRVGSEARVHAREGRAGRAERKGLRRFRGRGERAAETEEESPVDGSGQVDEAAGAEAEPEEES